LNPISFVSQTSIRLRGKAIAGALDRQQKLPGFNQRAYSRASVLCIGAGGLIGKIAPTLVRKGIGALTIVDHDIVEATNLHRQFFYPTDIGKNKAIALAANLQRECTFATRITGHAMAFQEAAHIGMDLACDAVVVGVDNNMGRVAASRYFRERGIAVVFSAVSRDADSGYVFAQAQNGACIGCIFPDIADDQTHPCPGVAAVADILQLLGGLSIYTLDTFITQRPRDWSFRWLHLSSAAMDSCRVVLPKQHCGVCH